ncbi:MAG: LysE family transporter, partial [Nitrosopumilaceae archaeon]
SALNPFFIIWWLTIGFKLISDSLILWSFWGIGIMFLLHIWMDYVWLSSTAMISSRISKVLSNRNFKFLIVVLSIVLVYFGITFLIQAFV